MQMQTEIVSIEHKYSDHELAQIAREQSEALSEIANLEDRLSSLKKDFGARIDEKKAIIRTKSTRITTGSEYRDVRCLLLKEQPAGHQISIRMDTATIVKCRRLRHDERQMELTEGQQPERQVARAILPVATKDMAVDHFEVFLTQKELEAMVDNGAKDFTFMLLPQAEEVAAE